MLTDKKVQKDTGIVVKSWDLRFKVFPLLLQKGRLKSYERMDSHTVCKRERNKEQKLSVVGLYTVHRLVPWLTDDETIPGEAEKLKQIREYCTTAVLSMP